jgi:predicted dehydrogenase
LPFYFDICLLSFTFLLYLIYYQKPEGMKSVKSVVGFIGAGGIARAHAFAINSLRYYYDDSPESEQEAVCSAHEKSRETFATQFGFRNSVSTEEFFTNDKVDTVFILGPNRVHYEHLKAAVRMPVVKRIYVEKPVCSNPGEEIRIAALLNEHPEIKIQTGYQFLFMPSVREALIFWRSGTLGLPLHFDLKYYHGDYLQKEYRDKRATRLTDAPDGGAMADLGSHAISLAIAFLGDKLEITGAVQSGRFEDVSPGSDLFSLISLIDTRTGAAGTVSASRIASGTGDMLSIELYAQKGSLRLSSQSDNYYEYYLEETCTWNRIMTGSRYKPVTGFPSGHVPPGWLRSLIHAHYVFLTGNDPKVFVPDMAHGLAVQRLVRETAEHLGKFRKSARL